MYAPVTKEKQKNNSPINLLVNPTTTNFPTNKIKSATLSTTTSLEKEKREKRFYFHYDVEIVSKKYCR